MQGRNYSRVDVDKALADFKQAVRMLEDSLERDDDNAFYYWVRESGRRLLSVEDMARLVEVRGGILSGVGPGGVPTSGG